VIAFDSYVDAVADAKAKISGQGYDLNLDYKFFPDFDLAAEDKIFDFDYKTEWQSSDDKYEVYIIQSETRIGGTRDSLELAFIGYVKYIAYDRREQKLTEDQLIDITHFLIEHSDGTWEEIDRRILELIDVLAEGEINETAEEQAVGWI
jgi:hypothetical protein